jgi:hypothetical protein
VFLSRGRLAVINMPVGCRRETKAKEKYKSTERKRSRVEKKAEAEGGGGETQKGEGNSILTGRVCGEIKKK